MKIPNLPLTYGALLLLFWLLPLTPAEAHRVLSTKALALDDTHAAFLITFELGFLNREAHVPALGYSASSSAGRHLAYEIVHKDGAVVDSHGVSNAVVLSNDTTLRADGQYHIPEGRNRTFTLLTLFDSGKPLSQDIALVIRELPLTIQDKDGKRSRFTFSPTELVEYRTDPLSITNLKR